MRRLLFPFSRVSGDEHGESDAEDTDQSEVCGAWEFILIFSSLTEIGNGSDANDVFLQFLQC
jgi:hypothetical protein